MGIFIDFLKAFDTIQHSILLKKLDHNGIRGIAHDLIKDYLTKVRPKQIWQDRAFNLFAICLAYESSASLKVKCDQVWPMIII